MSIGKFLFSAKGRVARMPFLIYIVIVYALSAVPYFYFAPDMVPAAQETTSSVATDSNRTLSQAAEETQQSMDDAAMQLPILLGGIILVILWVYIYFVVHIKRLHDANVTGWASLLLLIPLVSYVVTLALLFIPGTKGDNRFGPPPK